MGSKVGVPTIVAAEKSTILLKTKRIVSSKERVAVMIDSGFSII